MQCQQCRGFLSCCFTGTLLPTGTTQYAAFNGTVKSRTNVEPRFTLVLQIPFYVQLPRCELALPTSPLNEDSFVVITVACCPPLCQIIAVAIHDCVIFRWDCSTNAQSPILCKQYCCCRAWHTQSHCNIVLFKTLDIVTVLLAVQSSQIYHCDHY